MQQGYAYVCPGGKHIYIEKNGSISLYNKERFDYNYSPSVDMLFTSTAQSYGDKSINVIMTGMGSDGMEGARIAKSAGSYVVAQSEDSCTIYGMPRVVVENNFHHDIIHLNNIARRINNLCI